MNILSIFYKQNKGGFSKRLNMLCEAFCEEGHRVYYVSSEIPSIKHRNLSPVIINPWLRHASLFFWFGFIIKFLVKSLSTVKENKIDLIVTFGPFYTTLCMLPIIFYGTPAVTFIRADNMKHSTNQLRNTFFFIIDWVGVRLSNKILVVSNSLKQAYRKRYGIDDQKIDIQPNDIERKYTISNSEKSEIRRDLGVDNITFLITTSGVFNKGKNISLLIRAMKHLKHLKCQLAIIGDETAQNGEKVRLKNIVSDLELGEQVIFCGWQEIPARFIACSDLYVYPSLYEGSPNSLLEALGCSVPCLGSDIPEIREILKFNDLLFPLQDERDLAKKILTLRNDPEYYQQVKELSQICSEKLIFDWGHETINKLINIKSQRH